MFRMHALATVPKLISVGSCSLCSEEELILPFKSA
jgi:hypothetical protein